MSLNPKGEVPFFIHDKTQVSQSMAIIFYIEGRWPSRPLFPADPSKKAMCHQICEMINSGIQPLQNLKVMQEIKKRFKSSDEEKMKWSQFWIEEGLKAVEKILGPFGGPFCLGDELTAADFFLIPQVYNAKRFGVNFSEFPIISMINDHCLKREAFKLADPCCQPDSP